MSKSRLREGEARAPSHGRPAPLELVERDVDARGNQPAERALDPFLCHERVQVAALAAGVRQELPIRTARVAVDCPIDERQETLLALRQASLHQPTRTTAP